MRDREINDILESARSSDSPQPESLTRISASIRESLRPVRPLPPAWLLTAALALVCAAVALAGAARAGFDGIEKMAPWVRGLVFATLGIFIVIAANASVKAVIPGIRRRFSTGPLLSLCTLALLAALALSFRDYHVDHFVSAGIACLITGLLHALPVALLAGLILRRGFAVRPATAGWIAGTLAGLAGVSVLELHCVNFEAAHVLFWHMAVIPVSAAIAAIAAAAWHRLHRFLAP